MPYLDLAEKRYYDELFKAGIHHPTQINLLKLFIKRSRHAGKLEKTAVLCRPM
jgi:hypothetical protein